MSDDVSGLESLQTVLGHSFRDPDLLSLALTHPSALAKGRKGRGDYERLEFVGDRVLGLVISEWLYEFYRQADVGRIASRYNELVRRETLAEVALEIGLDKCLIMAASERGTGGASKPAILADACEAVIAALYLEGGLDAARDFVRRLWHDRVAGLKQAPRDPKTEIQELAHARGVEPPKYTVLATDGPDHAPMFTIEAACDLGTATAQGPSKKEAERSAARELLKQLQGT